MGYKIPQTWGRSHEFGGQERQILEKAKDLASGHLVPDKDF